MWHTSQISIKNTFKNEILLPSLVSSNKRKLLLLLLFHFVILIFKDQPVSVIQSGDARLITYMLHDLYLHLNTVSIILSQDMTSFKLVSAQKWNELQRRRSCQLLKTYLIVHFHVLPRSVSLLMLRICKTTSASLMQMDRRWV